MRRVLGCTGGASLFPSSPVARKRRSATQQQWELLHHHHHHPPSLSCTTTLAPIHIHRIHSNRLQLLAVPSITCRFRPTASPSNPYTPGAVVRSAAKTNSLQHHQKVRSHLRPAIDRNPRRPSTDPRPRGNDTALIHTRRSSKIANQQALASRSQSRGHSSASE